jgi:hypothetical protein
MMIFMIKTCPHLSCEKWGWYIAWNLYKLTNICFNGNNNNYGHHSKGGWFFCLQYLYYFMLCIVYLDLQYVWSRFETFEFVLSEYCFGRFYIVPRMLFLGSFFLHLEYLFWLNWFTIVILLNVNETFVDS